QWNIHSRMHLLDYAEKHPIPVPSDKLGEAPFSIDANLLHTSPEGKILENPAEVATDHVSQRPSDPVDAPDTPAIIAIG
ncbi:argininosuccinate synthase, partial [Rhizobium ruizarguesonis]